MVRFRKIIRRKRIRRIRPKRTVRLLNPLRSGVRNTARKFRANFNFFVPVTGAAAAGGMFRQLVIPFNYPGMVRSFNNTRTLWTNMGSAEQSANFPNFFGLQAAFDQYKVMKITVSMLPAEQQVMGTTEDWPTSDYGVLMYTMLDTDSDAFQADQQGYLNAGIVPFNLAPGKTVRRVFRQLKENRNKWLNAQAYDADPNDAATPISQTGPNSPAASIKCAWYLNNGSQTNAPHIGRLYVTYDVMFRAMAGT